MQQDPLFHENFAAALIHAVNALGGCASVGLRLWPTKTARQAETKLANCLNQNHEWKLDLEEIVAILQWAREVGIHCAMHKFCEQAGYSKPEIAPAKTPKQQLVEKWKRVVAEMEALAEEEAALERGRGS